MPNFSFDIVSEVNKAETTNVLDQTKRELNSRYDLKGTSAAIEWLDDNHSGYKITADSDFQIDAILDIIRRKLSSRDLSQKLIDVSKDPVVSGFKATKEVPFQAGIDQTKAKELQKNIRDSFPKIKSQIIGESVRISSSSKDELQSVIKLIRGQELDYPIQITNFR